MRRTDRRTARTPRGRHPVLPALLLTVLVLAGVAPARAAPPAPPGPPVLLASAAGPVTAPVAAGVTAAAGTSRSGYDWPLAADGDEPTVLHDFDPPPQRWLPGHRGVDLAAELGVPVRAAGPGTVAFAGMVAGRPVVSVQHPDGLRTTYEPVTPTVEAGDAVETGSVIGHLSEAGSHCGSTCLHWGVRTGADAYLDPLLLLGGEVVIRLYPPAQG